MSDMTVEKAQALLDGLAYGDDTLQASMMTARGINAIEAAAPDLARAYIAQAAENAALHKLCEDRFNEIADLERQLAEARDKALEEAALVADVERHARLARQVANSDLSGITLMHGQVAEAMKSLAVAIRNLKGPKP